MYNKEYIVHNYFDTCMFILTNIPSTVSILFLSVQRQPIWSKSSIYLSAACKVEKIYETKELE